MDFVKLDDCYWMLPDGIFINMFGFLELEDRQNVRLTCRRFYKLCDDSLIQSTEVIALRGTLNTVPALHCLSRSSRRIQNIKLRDMRLNAEAVLPFFKQHGSHLRSVDLIKCSFDQGALKVMIEHCSHLRQFAVECSWEGFKTVLRDLKDLVHNSIVRHCVTDFSLIMSPLSDSIIHQIICHFFAIFPRIRKLNLNIYTKPTYSWYRAFDMSRVMSSDVSSCLLAMADQLEVLNCSFFYGVPKDFFNLPLKNLKQLSLSWFYHLPDILPMYHSSQFERLTYFNCSIDYLGEVNSSYPFVQRLLQFAPLQSLTIHCCEIMDRQLFKALVESKLKSLEIGTIRRTENLSPVRDHENTEPLFFENKLMPNYCLQHLTIDRCDCDLTFLFAHYFRSVNRLKFSELNEGVLRNILNDQTTIRSLNLCHTSYSGPIKEVSDFQDCLRKVSTCNRELRYLTELQITEVKYSLDRFLLSEFVLPKLKKLTLTLYRKIRKHDVDELFDCILKLPQLQSLDLYSPSVITYPQWLRLCKASTKLRHLRIQNDGKFFTLSKYVQLFEVAPSLRTIKHESSYRLLVNYLCYDVIEKTVKFDDNNTTTLNQNYPR